MRFEKSQEYFKRAEKVMPAGINYAIRWMAPHPIYMHKGYGSKVFDVDNNLYTDYWMGHGALILGHANREVIDAVKARAELGTHLGFPNEPMVELAEKIASTVPNVDMVRFTNSGTEANMYATRLARAFTQRETIGKIEGGWHGGFDALQIGVHRPFDGKESAGLSDSQTSNTILIKFNDENSLRAAFEKNELAAVIVEPVLGSGGIVTADKKWFTLLRKLCDESGTLLIFDEVITGFRVALGGAQEYLGAKADLVVMGKIMGGGFPAGAIGGSKEIMSLLDHRNKKRGEVVFHGGTFAANPMTMTAGLETLKILEREKPYKMFEKRSEEIARKLEDLGKDRKISVSVTWAPAVFAVHFMDRKPKNALESYGGDAARTERLHRWMLKNGIIYMGKDMAHFFLSTAHSEEDVSNFVEIFDSFLKEEKGR
ncbi:MAG: aspartate aminotransferase family protein [Candidatus Thermoplasmatota archaeon]|nr:aspartate aminotransferase family protein [Candidatus Thermoplasmatota archaeon]